MIMKRQNPSVWDFEYSSVKGDKTWHKFIRVGCDFEGKINTS